MGASSGTIGLAKGAVTGYHDVTSNSEQALMDAVSKGPVSIAIEADKDVFQHYQGGVLSKMCGTNLDHGVLVVGSGKPGPSPGPSPPAPPSPPSPGKSHYEEPPCRSDEVALQVQGITGVTCSPSCTTSPCPTDVPAGTTATPECMLKDPSTGDQYCALSCFISGCPPGASCKHSGLAGICMYPAQDMSAPTNVSFASTQVVV